MADHELNILVKAKGALAAARDIGKVDSSVGKLSSTAARGAKTAARNVALIGVGVAAGVGAAAKAGIASLAELEDAQTSVTGSIEQMGLAGQVTAGQVATWANEIESNVEAAFDDKAIVAATSTLIRFGKVTPKNIRPAMEVMTDLAVKTGSVESASALLAKALANPEKAAGKLAKSGVILTKQQEKQIKAHMKVGDVAKAQGVILDALAKTTEGAAKASAGPYRDSLNILADVTEDAQRALGEGFLPVITKVSELLRKGLGDKQNVAMIREFGKGIASGLDSLIEIARNLPWTQIGDSMKLAGAGAKTILGAFSSLPPWVQTAVLTGWGLNKLTGGALGGIAGELGKGLIKGVLGMNAGVVNIKAGVVNGAGGGMPGAAGGAAGAAGAAGWGGSIAAALPLVLPAVIAAVASSEITKSTNAGMGTNFQAPLAGGIGGNIITGLHNLGEVIKLATGQTTKEVQTARARVVEAQNRGTTAVERSRAAGIQSTTQSAQKQIRSIDRTNNAIEILRRGTGAAISASAAKTAAASRSAGSVAKSGGIAAAVAIRNKRMRYTTNVNVVSKVSVSVRDQFIATQKQNRYSSNRED